MSGRATLEAARGSAPSPVMLGGVEPADVTARQADIAQDHIVELAQIDAGPAEKPPPLVFGSACLPPVEEGRGEIWAGPSFCCCRHHCLHGLSGRSANRPPSGFDRSRLGRFLAKGSRPHAISPRRGGRAGPKLPPGRERPAPRGAGPACPEALMNRRNSRPGCSRRPCPTGCRASARHAARRTGRHRACRPCA